MEYNISRWLQDDLGLNHTSESDLNSLIYHPRYGTLCRRLMNFLAVSTLCGNKYPNVFVKEEWLAAKSELELKNKELQELKLNLEKYAKENENKERELIWLKSRSDHLKKIEDLQQSSINALNEIANRPNYGLEQVASNIDKAEYLSNDHLDKLYSCSEVEEDASDTIMTHNQLAALDKELEETTCKINSVHKAISDLVQRITDNFGCTETDIKLKKCDISSLESLKIPKVEEVIVEVDPEAANLKKISNNLGEEIQILDEQVVKMSEEYKLKKNQLIRSHKELVDKFFTLNASLKDEFKRDSLDPQHNSV